MAKAKKAKDTKKTEAVKQNLVIQNDYQNVIDFGKIFGQKNNPHRFLGEGYLALLACFYWRFGLAVLVDGVKNTNYLI